MIKAIAFDYGGVIVLMENLTEEVSKYLGVSTGDWHKVYFSLNHLANTGENTFGDIFSMTAKKLGATNEQISEIAKIRIENKKTIRLNNELLEIIKSLRKNNYKVALLSNNSSKLRGWLIKDEISDLFDEIIISAEVGHQKPSPEIFEILFNKLDVESDEVAFVDDTEKSLEGAEKIGYSPILFTENQKLKEDLEKLGVKC